MLRLHTKAGSGRKSLHRKQKKSHADAGLLGKMPEFGLICHSFHLAFREAYERPKSRVEGEQVHEYPALNEFRSEV
jgi:hypothetical protein